MEVNMEVPVLGERNINRAPTNADILRVWNANKHVKKEGYKAVLEKCGQKDYNSGTSISNIKTLVKREKSFRKSASRSSVELNAWLEEPYKLPVKRKPPSTPRVKAPATPCECATLQVVNNELGKELHEAQTLMKATERENLQLKQDKVLLKKQCAALKRKVRKLEKAAEVGQVNVRCLVPPGADQAVTG